MDDRARGKRTSPRDEDATTDKTRATLGSPASRRAFLRGLTAVPTAIVLGRALGGCSDGDMPGRPLDASVPIDFDVHRDAQRRDADAARGDAMGMDATLVDAEEDDASDTSDTSDTSDADATDATPDAEPTECERSDPDAQGPFFADGTPLRSVIAPSDEPGDRLKVRGVLRAATFSCDRLAGHYIDVWQANASGVYYDPGPSDYRLRGRLVTADDGSFELETIMPGHYGDTTGPRPKHLHFKIYSPEGVELLVTQIYFVGDPYLGENDSCGPPTCFSGDEARHVALRAEMVGGRAGLGGDLDLFV